MFNMVRNGARTAAAAGIASIFTATGLFAQDAECQPEANTAAATASEELQELAGAATATDSMAVFQEAWEAIAVDLDSDNWVVSLLATQILLGMGDFAEAEGMLGRFDEVAPPECAMHGENQRYAAWVQLYNRGVAAYGASENQTALDAFLLANDFKPDFRTYANAALLQSQMGDNAGAIETYRAALAADIPDAEPEQRREAVRSLGAALMQEGRGDEAAEAYEGYLADNPDDVIIQIGYADVLEDQGRSEEAAAIFASTFERTDLGFQQWLQVGVGLFNAGNYEDASVAFGNARDINPYNKEANENYVNASIQAGRPGPMIELAATLTDWYPYDQLAHQLYAQALGRADMNDRAMEAISAEQELPLSFTFSQMAPAANGGYVLQVAFTARSASGTIQIPFEFVDAGGAVVTTHTQTVDAGAGTFSFEIQVDVPLAGFRYGTIAS